MVLSQEPEIRIEFDELKRMSEMGPSWPTSISRSLPDLIDHKNILPTTLIRMIISEGRVGGNLWRCVQKVDQCTEGMRLIPIYIKGSENIL